jgi:hypothetical protein
MGDSEGLMRHPTIRAIYAYWNDIRAGRAAPNRTEINPVRLGSALPDVFMLDAPEKGSSFRLVGSRIANTLGREPTSLVFSEIFVEDARRNARAALSVAANDGEPMLIGLRLIDPSAPLPDATPAIPLHRPRDAVRRMVERRMEPRRAGEMVLLPLFHQGRVGTRVLGALAMFDPVRERAPRVLGLDVSGTRVLGLQARPAQGIGLVPAAVADTILAKRGHLTLIRGSAPEGDAPERG